MTQLILGINGALMALQAGVMTLTDLNDTTKAIIVIACSVGIAFINPWLPKVSAATRRVMELRHG